MASQWSVLTGMGLGAGLLYILDPATGRRRRAVAAQKAGSLARESAEFTGRAARDLRNRAHGTMAVAARPLRHEEVDEPTLEGRVRAKLGRVVSHPHAIEVTVDGGRVVLAGPVLSHEAGELLAKIAAVRGVDAVEDRLLRHETAEGVPALQGGVPRAELSEIRQANWAPGIRCLAATAGSGLVAWGLRRRGGLGLALGTAGTALLARASANGRAPRGEPLPL